MSILKNLINDILNDKTAGYTVARIAKECGLSETTIRKILSGKTKDSRHDTAVRLFSLYFSING